MKINKIQRSINTSSLVIVSSIIITLILSIFNTGFICLLMPISISYLILIAFDFLDYFIIKKIIDED